MPLLQKCGGEPTAALGVREDADHARASVQLFVEALVPVRRADPQPMRRWEAKAGQRLLAVALQPRRQIGMLCLEIADQLVEPLTRGFVAERLIPDLAESRMKLVFERLRRLIQRVHQKM